MLIDMTELLTKLMVELPNNRKLQLQLGIIHPEHARPFAETSDIPCLQNRELERWRNLLKATKVLSENGDSELTEAFEESVYVVTQMILLEYLSTMNGTWENTAKTEWSIYRDATARKYKKRLRIFFVCSRCGIFPVWTGGFLKTVQ